MKQYIFPTLLGIFILLLASCKNDSKKEREAAESEYSNFISKINSSSVTQDGKKVTFSESGLVVVHDEIGKGDSIEVGEYVHFRYKLYLLSDVMDSLSFETVTDVSDVINQLDTADILYENYYAIAPHWTIVYYSSYSTSYGIPGKFEGFHASLIQMREGGKATLIIPYDLADGANGTYDIPDYANLIIQVWVTDIGQ